LLTFPGGKNDDFVDACAQLGAYVNNMIKGSVSKQDSHYKEESNVAQFTLAALRRAHQQFINKSQPRYNGR